MEPALWIAKTGLDAQQTRMAVISNNLANVNTTGFKRGRASFEDLLYQTVRQPGASSSQNSELPSGLMLGTGVRIVSTEKEFSQGNVVQTDNSLDLAVQGRGFFQILLPDGTLSYTRDGSFEMNSQGVVVTSSGYELQPAITVPSGTISVTVGSDGTVSALVAGQSAPTQIGSVQLTDFINPLGLQPMGENLFKETLSSGTPQTGTPGLSGLGTLVQGSLESSNVNVVEELVNMIETQRSYEMNSKAISTVDQMLQYVSQNL
ncbi:MAG: flagellar basal-body rod protein FlgG [Gammaproteobacteria bacterium]|nr:flagellar basal-body rod protein FlgG [Gammaproteobacteria bacterium]